MFKISPKVSNTNIKIYFAITLINLTYNSAYNKLEQKYWAIIAIFCINLILKKFKLAKNIFATLQKYKIVTNNYE